MRAMSIANQAGRLRAHLSSAENHTHLRRRTPSSDRAVLTSHKGAEYGGFSLATHRRRAHVCSAGNTGPGSSPADRFPPTGSLGDNDGKYTWQDPRNGSSGPEVVVQQAGEFRALVEEIIQITFSAGPSGIPRALKAAEAVATTGTEWLQGDRPAPPALLRKLMERLGATYVKLGQFVASSPTLFPEEYVTEFQKCLDATTPIPFSTVREIVTKELGPLDSIFSSIEEVPIASASIAQVHGAVLRGSNKEVVLKVLKPGVSDILTADLSFLYIAARVLEFLNPTLKRTSLSAIVGDIRASMMEEVDFEKEARNISQFEDYLERLDLGREACCPFVYTDLSTKKVLTMERLRGAPLTDLDAIKAVSPGNNPEATLISALNTWFGSVMACETFHADVHAGNLLVLPDGRVGFIDFGIVGRISPVTWNAIQEFVGAATLNDFKGMARGLAAMGATNTKVDINGFARDLELLYNDINTLDADLVVATEEGAGGATVNAGLMMDETQINDLLLNVVRVGETHGVKFPREFGLLLKQVLYFDRYVRLLAPGLQVMSDERVRMQGYDAPDFGFDTDGVYTVPL